jgi:hypothetical protein
MTRPKKASQPYEHTADQPKHESVFITRLQGIPLSSLSDGVLATYSHHNDRFIAILEENLPRWRSFRALLNAAPLAHEAWTY